MSLRSEARETAVVTHADPSPPRTAASRRRRTHSTYPAWFAAPAMLALVAFFVLPNVMNFVYAFSNWSAFDEDIAFAGLQNFRNVLDDGTLRSVLVASIAYAVLVALFQNVAGLGLALLLEKDDRFNRVARAFFFLPVLLSSLAVGYVFQALLAPDGALNGALSAVAGDDVAFAWLGSTTWTLVVVTLVHSWKWQGLSMLIYLAGLKSIPGEVLEAARIDGVGRWQMFWRIKFPLIAPAVTFNVGTAVIGAMNSFDIVQATTKGGPADATQIFNVYIFRIFGQGLYAQATAISLLLFLVVLLMAVPLITYLRRREEVVR